MSITFLRGLVLASLISPITFMNACYGIQNSDIDQGIDHPREFLTAWYQEHGKPEGFLEAWRANLQHRETFLSADDLEKLYRAMQDRLTQNYFISYSFTRESPDSETIEQERLFAKNGVKAVLQHSWKTDLGDWCEANSFDGRQFQIYSKMPTGDFGRVSKLDSGVIQDIEGDILLRSLLVDMEACLGKDYPFQDIQALLRAQKESIWISDSLETINGYACFFIASPDFQVWVAPELNFAIVQTSWLQIKLPHTVFEYQSSIFSDFRKVGRGFWLPFKMESTQSTRPMDPDAPKSKQTVVVKRMDINFDDDSVYDIISEGVTVFDESYQTSYIKGKDSTIESMLNMAIQNSQETNSDNSIQSAAGKSDRLWLFAGIFLSIAVVFGLGRLALRNNPKMGVE